MYENLVLFGLFSGLFGCAFLYSVIATRLMSSTKSELIRMACLIGSFVWSGLLCVPLTCTLATIPSDIKQEEMECQCSIKAPYQYSMFPHYSRLEK